MYGMGPNGTEAQMTRKSTREPLDGQTLRRETGDRRHSSEAPWILLADREIFLARSIEKCLSESLVFMTQSTAPAD